MKNLIEPFQYSRFQKSFACFLEHVIPLQNEGSFDALLQESFQLFPSICNPLVHPKQATKASMNLCPVLCKNNSIQ